MSEKVFRLIAIAAVAIGMYLMGHSHGQRAYVVDGTIEPGTMAITDLAEDTKCENQIAVATQLLEVNGKELGACRDQLITATEEAKLTKTGRNSALSLLAMSAMNCSCGSPLTNSEAMCIACFRALLNLLPDTIMNDDKFGMNDARWKDYLTGPDGLSWSDEIQAALIQDDKSKNGELIGVNNDLWKEYLESLEKVPE